MARCWNRTRGIIDAIRCSLFAVRPKIHLWKRGNGGQRAANRWLPANLQDAETPGRKCFPGPHKIFGIPQKKATAASAA